MKGCRGISYDLRQFHDVGGTILDTNNISMFRQGTNSSGVNIQVSCVGGHVIDQNRDGALLGNHFIMGNYCALIHVTAVIKGGENQRNVGPITCREVTIRDSGSRGLSTTARDEWHAAI